MQSKDYFKKLSDLISNLNYEEFDIGAKLIKEAWQNGNQVITLGNGIKASFLALENPSEEDLL
jgi:hypothetical protein